MSTTASATHSNFDDDLTRLSKHFSPIVLKHQGRRVAVLPEVQGRITHASTPEQDSVSIGWLDRDYLEQDSLPVKGAIGGADRLWFGPDGGRFSVFFDPHADTAPENIRPPAALATDAFKVVSQNDQAVSLEHSFSFNNHLGFEFDVALARTVNLLGSDEVKSHLDIAIPNTVQWVAYSSSNTVTNMGKQTWAAETGLFSLWVLGMFEPEATVVIPLRKPLDKATNYFVPPSDDKVRIQGNTLFYNADAQLMNKVGVPPEHSTPVFGSYDERRKRLTIIKFTFDPQATDYVNAVWDWDAPPLTGEAINIFNDGPQANNGKPFGPFYEMETSSVALTLAPDERASHAHTTYHFVGDANSLNPIAKTLLGVEIEQIKEVFKSNP